MCYCKGQQVVCARMHVSLFFFWRGEGGGRNDCRVDVFVVCSSQQLILHISPPSRAEAPDRRTRAVSPPAARRGPVTTTPSPRGRGGWLLHTRARGRHGRHLGKLQPAAAPSGGGHAANASSQPAGRPVHHQCHHPARYTAGARQGSGAHDCVHSRRCSVAGCS